MTLNTNANSQSDDIELKDDKDNPVITLQYTGGFRRRPTEEPETMISVFADGRVVAGRTNPRIKRVEMKIDNKVLQQLLQFCIKDNGFMEMTTESIKKEIEASGKRVMIADAPSTEIMIATKDKENKVSVYALTFVMRQMSDIESVQKMGKIDQRLKRLHTLTVVGGTDGMKKMLAVANKALKEKEKDAKPFTAADATFASATSDGAISASFNRQVKDETGKVVKTYMAKIGVKKDGEPEVGVYIYDNRKR
jgi:ubiquinone/menaquinone biosynthesis C-methylase UbiE